MGFICVFFNWFAGFSWEILAENDQHYLRKFDGEKKFVAQAILPAPSQGNYMIVVYSSGVAALKGGAQEKSSQDTMDEILKSDTVKKPGLNKQIHVDNFLHGQVSCYCGENLYIHFMLIGKCLDLQTLRFFLKKNSKNKPISG